MKNKATPTETRIPEYKIKWVKLYQARAGKGVTPGPEKSRSEPPIVLKWKKVER